MTGKCKVILKITFYWKQLIEMIWGKWSGRARRPFFPPEGGVGLVPKRGCLLTLAYYAFPRWYESGERRWNDTDRRKTEELGQKPVPVPLCSPQIPHGLTRARTRASAVRGRRLTTRAMARPRRPLHSEHFLILHNGILSWLLDSMKCLPKRRGLNSAKSSHSRCFSLGVITRSRYRPDRPVVQPVVRHYTAWANPALFSFKYIK
jgi:hypothetical protein